MDKNKGVFLNVKELFTHSWRRFHSVFFYRLRHYSRSIVYAVPFFATLLGRTVCRTSAKVNKDPAFWDGELAGPYKWYLGGTLPIDIRRSVMAELIHHCMPDFQSVLDVGCGTGGLAPVIFKKNSGCYVGVDISEYAIEKARKWLLDSKKLQSVSFHNSNLCDFTPGNDAQFDVIIFGEVLYYIDIKESVVQLERYSNWLRPGGVFCISMKDDPKSHAIYRAISKKYKHLNSVLLQVSPAHCGIKYRNVLKQECPVFSIGIFAPKHFDKYREIKR